jgi:signal transduction histidine kinase
MIITTLALAAILTDNAKLVALIRKTPQYGAESRTDLLGLARLAADALEEAERKIAELEQSARVSRRLHDSTLADLRDAERRMAAALVIANKMIAAEKNASYDNPRAHS